MKKQTKSKNYTRRQIKEAISYWKNELRAIREAEEEAEEGDEEGSDGGVKTEDEDAVEEKAKKTPVGDFGIAARMHRLHLGAASKTKKELAKFLNKYKASEAEAVQIKNSCDDGDAFEMPEEGDQMVVTVQVEVDKAHVKGFRKMIALMKENDDEIMNEGFLKDLWGGFKKGAGELKKVSDETIDALGKTAKEKIDNANEKLKKQIGVAAMKMYLTSFCGRKIGDKVSLKNIAIGQDEDGDGAQITFCCAVNVR